MEVVNEMWYKELEEPDTFYMNATALKLLAHITEFCLCLHTIHAVEIPQLIKTLFTDANGILQFINAIETAQQNSKREKLEIQDEYMHSVALNLLLQSGEYETEMRECSKLANNQQTCTACKTTFREEYVANRQAQAVR